MVGNEYVHASQDEFLAFAIAIDEKLTAEVLEGFIAYAKTVSKMENQTLFNQTLFDIQRPIANDYLGRIRIIELGEEIDDNAFLLRSPRGLQELKADIEAIFKHAEEEDNAGLLSSVSSAVFSKKGGIALLLLATGYFGYSYWNNAKKAQQSN